MRLYERAASIGKPNTLLCVTQGAVFWAGSAHYLAEHQGGVAVFLCSLYGRFRLRLPGQPWVDTYAALIPPGLSHELDFAGEPFASLYVEPGYGGEDALRPLLWTASAAEGGAMVGTTDMIPLLRGFYENLSSEAWVAPGLKDLLGFTISKNKAEATTPRFKHVMDLLNGPFENREKIADFARLAGLSPSRFQHLFTKEAGVPFRRYRAWSRLRRAWLEIAQGATMTEAAHAAGFFDSAHLSHEYRRTFGKAASGGVRRIFRVSSSFNWPSDDQ